MERGDRGRWRERDREKVERLDVVVNGFGETEELWMCVFFVVFFSPEWANRGMEWLSMGVVGLVQEGGRFETARWRSSWLTSKAGGGVPQGRKGGTEAEKGH